MIIEGLEQRQLMAIDVSFYVDSLTNSKMVAISGASADNFFARSNNGVLEWSPNGLNYTDDFNTGVSGVQQLQLTTSTNLVLDATSSIISLNGVLVGPKVSLGSISVPGGSLTAKAYDQIDVLPNSTISTIASTAGGSILFETQIIRVGASSKLLSDGSASAGDITLKTFVRDLSGLSPVDVFNTPDPTIAIESGAEIRGGEVTLEATKKSAQPLLPIQLLSLQHKKASVTLNGANVSGTKVEISATAEDANIADSDTFDIVNNMIGQSLLRTQLMQLIPIPAIFSAISVQQRAADAVVTVSGSQINSSGDVSIGASIDISSAASASGAADATKKKPISPAEFVPFSAGYSKAEGKASTVLDGNTTINANGSVDILSDATVSATVSAFTVSNSGKSKKISGSTSVPSIAVAVTDTNVESTAYVGESVTIIASGNVTIDAKGDVTNQARSAAITYGDGTGGVGFSRGTDKTTITTTVNGRIQAGGISNAKKLALSQINEQLNTLHIPDHGFVDGDIFVYHAETPTEEPTPLTAIGGLEDGETYHVIVLDANNIQLAKSSTIQFDKAGISADTMNSLSRRAAKSVLASAVDLQFDAIALPSHGFTELQPLTVVTTKDWNLKGFGENAAYFAHILDANRFQVVTRNAEGAGVNPTLLPGTDLYIVNLDFTPPSDNSSPSTPQGTLVLGYDEVPKLINALAAVQTGGILEIPTHGWETGDQINYSVVPDNTPEKVNLNRTNLFSPASSELVFNPNDPDAGIVDNAILVPDTHTLVTGQRVVYSAGSGGTAIGGLTNNQTYYVVNAGEFGFQLATTQQNALAGIAIPLTSSGTGTAHKLQVDTVNLVANQIVLRNHQLQTGQSITYISGDNPSLGGLENNKTYYVIRVSDSIVSLARSRQDASAGIAIDISTLSSGQHGIVTDKFVSTVDADRQAPVVDYLSNTIEIKSHGLTSGQQVSYDPTDSDPIVGLDKGSYEVLVVDANHFRLSKVGDSSHPIDFLPGLVDSSYQTFTYTDSQGDTVQLSFDPLQQPTVNPQDDTIWLRSHEFEVGERVRYLAGGNNVIGGLQDGQEYVVLAGIDSNTFRLATVEQPATAIQLTTSGNGTQGFERASTARRGNIAISGLRDGGSYYVTKVDENHIRLSLTQENAFAAEPIDLSLSTQQRSNLNVQHSYTTEIDEQAGINISSNLEADNSSITDGQVGGSPTLSDMFLGFVPIDPIVIVNAYKSGKVKSPSPASITAATSITNYEHAVHTIVGSHADLSSNKNVNIDAKVENYSKAIADSTVIAAENGKKLFGAAVAVTVGAYSNDVSAIVDSGATIDAQRSISVNSEVMYPDQTKFLPFNVSRYSLRTRQQ